MLGSAADSLARREAVTVNGRNYAWPKRPTVVICFDGCDPEYIVEARRARIVPTLEAMMAEGFSAEALAAMPTFTNPNNVSIVCGAPPSVHGVSGNFYLDRATGDEVMMVDASPMRAPTILAHFSQAGAGVVAITAKDKLRKALSRDLHGIAFSAEKVSLCTEPENGISGVLALVDSPAPDQYSAELSLFVLDAGIRLLAERRPDLLYLSLSDYVQHKHAPGTEEANAFMAAVDERLAKLLALAAIIGIVADHGMNDMSRPDGAPNVLYLGDRLDERFGPGRLRVICPITDPFVRHHGALGGFVRVHILDQSLDRDDVRGFVQSQTGVSQALVREEACRRFSLPEDREGDIAVNAERGFALGARVSDHDLTQLAGSRLRSHGGEVERPVPFILSHRLRPEYVRRASAGLDNFDIFDFALNGVEI